MYFFIEFLLCSGIDISLLIMKLENGYRLEKPQMCPQEIFNVIYVCWRHKDKRPTFNDVVKQLKSAIYEVYQITFLRYLQIRILKLVIER